MRAHNFRLGRQVLVMTAIGMAFAGCAVPEPKAWRVAPAYRVTHSGPKTVDGYVALARQYEGERRWGEACVAWREAARAAPQDADIQNALGLAEASQGRYALAIAALRRAVALDPERAKLLNNLGYALLLDGKHNNEAKTYLQEALSRSPNHQQARANLNRVDQPAGAPVTADLPVAKELAAKSDLPVSVSANVPALEVQTVPNLAQQPTRQSGLLVEKVIEPRAKIPLARIEITNGNGVSGMAAWLGKWLHARGLPPTARLSNAVPFNTAVTVVYYREGYLSAAQALAERMPQHVTLAHEPGGVPDADVRVVLGLDLRAMTPCLRNCPTYATTIPESLMASL